MIKCPFCGSKIEDIESQYKDFWTCELDKCKNLCKIGKEKKEKKEKIKLSNDFNRYITKEKKENG